MSRFVQLHLLTSYPPANLNRDDLGRPKTAVMGGEPRLRISSQSLKRAWRSSFTFIENVSNGEYIEDLLIADQKIPKNMGIRSKQFALEWMKKELMGKAVTEEQAELWSKDMSRALGVVEKDSNELSQLVFVSGLELQGCKILIGNLAQYLVKHRKKTDETDEENEIYNNLFSNIEKLQDKRSKTKKSEEIKKLEEKIGKGFRHHILRLGEASVDIALFGRMLASSPVFNTEAAAQVAHAISVHSVTVEDDFFAAVDDLNRGEDDAGAGHLGETEFAAGLFYLYICIDKELLVGNLSGNEELADKTLGALIETAATVAPTGKQNSFASRARASYILCETGNQQPRSLSVAFLKPVQKGDMLSAAIKRLCDTMENMDKVYGACANERSAMNVQEADGSLQGIIECAKKA